MNPPTDSGGPLTPAMLETIQRLAARERRVYLVWTIVFGALTIVFGVLYLVAPNGALIIFSALCAALLLVFLLISQFANRAVERRMMDIAYVRTAGPMAVQSYQTQSAGNAVTRYRLILADRRIQLDSQSAAALEKVMRGTAIYVPFTFGRNILLEVLDEQGNSIYRRPGYAPE
jgi:uncharacterized protein (DUF58 family)